MQSKKVLRGKTKGYLYKKTPLLNYKNYPPEIGAGKVPAGGSYGKVRGESGWGAGKVGWFMNGSQWQQCVQDPITIFPT